MRRALARLAVAALVCGSAAPARAATLFFTGTLTLSHPTLFGPTTFSGSGVATSAGGGFSLPSNAFVGTETATTTNGAAPPVTGNLHVISGHGPGSFGGAPFGGSMPLAGRIDVLAYGGVELFEIRFAGTGGAVGAGGTFSYPQALPVAITVQAASWTTGFQSFPSNLTLSGGIPTLAGFDDRNAKGVGTTRLVTHYYYSSALFTNALGFATLDLSFVPEPPGAAGVALGAAALVAVDVGRRRSRRD